MKRLVVSCLLVLLVLPFADVEARPAVDYGPVPEGIAAVVASERDQTLARAGLATLGLPRANHSLAASLLILLDDVGLKAVAERLASGEATRRSLPYLLEVVGSSEHPDADILLERAAGETRPVLRMLAADGLGRGRSPRAVPVLARLTEDPVPGVRIAALRSLFAIESPQARAARMTAPADGEAPLLAKRLRWHRRCEDVSEETLTLAHAAYFSGESAELRLAAATYLAMPSAKAPLPTLRLLLLEMGAHPFLGALFRKARMLPEQGYEPAALRRIAIEVALTLLGRADLPADVRKRVIAQAVSWIADPVQLDAYGKETIPEHRLRRRLPDFGAEIVPPVLARLRAGAFDEPRQGVILIRELGPDIALPALRSLLAPRTAPDPFESRAEAQRRRYLRNAAAGALHELGQVGDEALARSLLLGDESTTLKIDILLALANEPGTWTVPLLAEVVKRYDSDLRSYALDVLEQRPEPEARALLVDDLFARMDRPHDRLRPLVREGDDEAVAIMRRALEDERTYMRKAALSQFLKRRNPKLCGPKGRAVLMDFDPVGRGEREVQAYVYALLNTDPERAVRYVDANWDAFPRDGMRMTCLRILGEAQGTAARHAAVDFALTKAVADAPMQMLMSIAAVLGGPAGQGGRGGYGWSYRVEDVTAFWQRLVMSDDVRLQREAIKAYTHEKAPDVADRLLELFALALAGKAFPERASTPSGEEAFAGLLIEALPYQTWDRVEDRLLEVALEPLTSIGLRVEAAQALIGNLSDAGRTRLIEWLDYTEPAPGEAKGAKPGVSSNALLQLFLAAAIGEGADARIAELLHGRLKQELFAYYDTTRLFQLVRDGPAQLQENEVETRVNALARGIAKTGHVPTISALLEVVFDLRFALYARACVQDQAYTTREASVSAAAVTPSSIELLTHRTPDSWLGIPRSVHNILYETKSLDDATLSAALERVLQERRQDGRLAHFPTLYLYRVLMNLVEPHTGRKPRSAAIVYRFARRTGRLDAPQQFQMAREAAIALGETGRFAEAAAAQTHAVRVIARGNHDDARPGMWRYQRAVLDALQGAAFARRGDAEAASESFVRATLRDPGEPNVHNVVAWYRALSDAGLEQAEVSARYATRLEARVENRPTPNAADTLAYVLLKRGRPREGLRVLGPRMRERGAVDNGLLYLHMAELHAAANRLRSSRDALVEALTWDRALEPGLANNPYLAPLFEKTTIEDVSKRAAARRLEERLP